MINHLAKGEFRDSWSQYIDTQNNSCIDEQQKEQFWESILKKRMLAPKFDNVLINQSSIYNFREAFYQWGQLS